MAGDHLLMVFDEVGRPLIRLVFNVEHVGCVLVVVIDDMEVRIEEFDSVFEPQLVFLVVLDGVRRCSTTNSHVS